MLLKKIAFYWYKIMAILIDESFDFYFNLNVPYLKEVSHVCCLTKTSRPHYFHLYLAIQRSREPS